MLDEPLNLSGPPHPQPAPRAGTSTSSRLSAPVPMSANGHSAAPFSLLLSGTASKYKSSSLGVGGLAAGKENGLLPSPRFVTGPSSSASSSSSSSATASSSSSTAATSSSSPHRESTSTSARPLRRNLKPALKRRVTFSPTPLASLQSSPSHAKRARPTGLLFAAEHERETKRRRRENVYSDNPLLAAARADGFEDVPSGSDLGEGGQLSSSSPMEGSSSGLPALPRSPPRPRFRSASSGLLRSAPLPLSSSASRTLRFVLDDAPSTSTTDVYPAVAEATEMTDSEEESEQVESLLLPASVSPKKPAMLPFVPPPLVGTGDLSIFPTAAAAATAEPSTSSSPLRSPSFSRSTRPAAVLLPPAPLRSILKQRPSASNFLVKDEREGLRKNGRGRRHVVGWETEEKTKAARDKRRSENAGSASGPVGQDATEAHGASGATAGAKGKGKERQQAAAPTTRETRSSSRAAKVPSTSRAAGLGGNGGGGGGDDDEPPRRRRAGDPGPGAPSSSAGGISTKSAQVGRRGAQKPTTKHEIPLDDPSWSRSPLLVLRASLRASTGAAAAGTRSVREGNLSALLPRMSPETIPLSPTAGEASSAGTFLRDLTTLGDVEDAYVSLKNAIFCLPSEVADPEATFEPLRTHADAFLGALNRDVDNIRTFPQWVAEQPRLVPESEEATAAEGMQLEPDAGADGPDGDEPSSSPSLSRRAAAAAGGGSAPRVKQSLTEAQMTRMRDELGAAQAAIKCAAACLKDPRVVALFEPAALAKLIENIAAIAYAPDLSVSVRRDLCPFLPFFLHSISASTADIIAPLLPTVILPSLRATLTLDPRVDRFRLSIAESLDALSVLVSEHGRATIRHDAWRIWLCEATKGLWDGTKKAISTRDKAIKVLGRVTRVLTVYVPSSDPWRTEREEVHAAIGLALREFFGSCSMDATAEPKDDKKEQTPNLENLLLQLRRTGDDGRGDAATDAAATKSLSLLSVLALIPALLGAEFRLLSPRGIGHWLLPFNELSNSPSPSVLALSALAWPHLAFAFLRVPPPANKPWMFATKGPSRTIINYVSLFKSRNERWLRGSGADADADRKAGIRVHAKALTLAFVGAVYGATVYTRFGTSSLRRPLAPLETAPTATQRDMFDRIFTDLLQEYLPSITTSAACHESQALGWQILSRIVRRRSAEDRSAFLESLVNPIFLDGSLAVVPPASSKMNIVLEAAMQRAVKTSSIPGWGEEWLADNVVRVLQLFGACLPESAEALQILQPEITLAWTTLLETVEAYPRALTAAFQWLGQLSASEPMISKALWTASIKQYSSRMGTALESTLLHSGQGLSLATRAYLDLCGAPAQCSDVLARVASHRLTRQGETDCSEAELEVAVLLLRHHTKHLSIEAPVENWCGLAGAVARCACDSEQGAEPGLSLLDKTVFWPEDIPSNLRLCIQLLAGSQRLEPAVQSRLLGLCQRAVGYAFKAPMVSLETASLLSKMIETAPDSTYAALYETVLERLAIVVNPTNDALQQYADLFAGPLARAFDHLSNPADALRLDVHAADEQRAIRAFDVFWKKTFGAAEQDLDFPESLGGWLKVMRDISEGFRAPGLVETQFSSEQSAPPAGQAGPPTFGRTSTSDDKPSGRGYDADTSRQPPPRPSDESADVALSKSAAIEEQPAAQVTASLRAPSEPNPLEDEVAQVIDETQSDILASEVHASFVGHSSRLLADRSASVAKSTRSRTASAAGEDRSLADHLPQHTSDLTLESQDEDVVRSFLRLPLDAVVRRVGEQLGGSPSLRRLVDLGEKAREYLERLGTASP
ncbi:hypothetical protein JCM8202v2_003214 [Rhodotorula sphaerocarpa]